MKRKAKADSLLPLDELVPPPPKFSNPHALRMLDSFLYSRKVGNFTFPKRKRSIPEWSWDNKAIREILLRSFPRLDSDEGQRIRAARWAFVIYQFFRKGSSYQDLAKRMRLTLPATKALIRSVRRAACGVRTSGSGALGGKRGRPLKPKEPQK